MAFPAMKKQWEEHRTMLSEFDVHTPTFGGFEGFPCPFPATEDHALEIARWTEDMRPDNLRS